MEPSFGDGAFLSEIIKRIIKEGLKLSLSRKKISDIIKDNVFGIEKDEKIYKKTICRLNWILEEYEMPKRKRQNKNIRDTNKVIFIPGVNAWYFFCAKINFGLFLLS